MKNERKKRTDISAIAWSILWFVFIGAIATICLS